MRTTIVLRRSTARRVLAGLIVAALLAGCGTSVRAPDGKARKPTVVQKRGGAYYQDDGPADDVPDNLDSIPDAQPRLEPLHRAANRPYVVLGKSYVPNATLKPMRQRGIASWYGRKFHGQKTSIGETYDMFAMTAAHPTLALPSYARVTHLGNGKSVVVRVTDRGPFHAGRIIDLSYAAAYRLGYVNDGSAQVEVDALLPTGSTSPLYAETRTPVLPPAKPPAAAPESSEFEQLMTQLAQNTKEDDAGGSAEAPSPSIETQNLFLQLGAFSNAENAENLRSHLARELDWLTDPLRVQGGGGIYRVQMGPYANRAEAEKVAEKISASLGYRPGFVSH